MKGSPVIAGVQSPGPALWAAWPPRCPGAAGTTARTVSSLSPGGWSLRSGCRQGLPPLKAPGRAGPCLVQLLAASGVPWACGRIPATSASGFAWLLPPSVSSSMCLLQGRLASDFRPSQVIQDDLFPCRSFTYIYRHPLSERGPRMRTWTYTWGCKAFFSLLW